MARVKARRLGRGRVELAVPIPTSADGTVGRRCPQCRRYFKVDGGRLSSTTALFCSYCGATGPISGFLTLDQKRRLRSAAASWAMSEMHQMLTDTLGSHRTISAGMISLSFEIGHVEIPPLLSYIERQTGRVQQCNKCGGLSASYGIAIFCPFCGERDSRETFSQSIRAARTALSSLGSLAERVQVQLQLAGGEDRLVENALGDAVTAFESYCRAMYAERAGDSALAALFKAKGRNVFQRLDDAVAIMAGLLSRDLKPELDASGWSTLRLAFATRHVLTHNFGVADAQFVAMTGSGVEGQRVQVTRTFAERTLSLVERIVDALA